MLTTIVIVFVLYLAAMLVISWQGRKHASTFDEFLSVGRKTPMILLIGGAVGAQVGNGLVVGGGAEGAATGLAGVGYGLGCAVGYLVVALISDKIYRSGHMIPADYFQDRYKSGGMSQMFNIICGIGCFPGIGAQIMAAKILFDALGLNSTICVIALCVGVFLYSQISGLWGAYATSVVQIVIIGVGVLAGAVYVLASGGWSEITGMVASGELPETFLSFSGYDAATWMMIFLPLVLTAPVDNVSWQRIHSAVDMKSARRAHWISTLVMLPLCFAPVIIGMYGRAHFGYTGNTAFFGVILNVFPPILAALVIVAVIAAVMSTIDGMIIASTTCWVRGFYKNVIDKNAPDEKLQKLTLPVNFATILLAAYFAFNSNTIIGLLSNMYIFTGSALLAPLVFGWWWKGTTTKGALAGVAVGTIYGALQLFGIYSLPWSGITYILPSFVALVVVSLLTKEKETA